MIKDYALSTGNQMNYFSIVNMDVIINSLVYRYTNKSETGPRDNQGNFNSQNPDWKLINTDAFNFFLNRKQLS